MRDEKLLVELLEAEDEAAVLAALNTRGLLDPVYIGKYWRYLGAKRNNEGIILTQQSSATAALVEKYTNGVDAILIRQCKALGIDPRSASRAPQSMAEALEKFFLKLDEKGKAEISKLAEENLVLYATGGKARPSLSFYDAGEGQLPENFANTFCSLLAADEGSYKGSIPFVQGRFNMGGTGVLPFCSKERMLQLVVSRVPEELGKRKDHEWGYTLMCFFPGENGGDDPAWRYLVGEDGQIRTAGTAPLALVPRTGAPKPYEAVPPRERRVGSGTLIKMYDYEAPKSNICGELYKKIEEYLLRPPLPLRIVECRKVYPAKVMAVTVWDCMARWARKGKLEEDFKDGASFEIHLQNGEKVPGEIRVFKAGEKDQEDPPHTGVRGLINGQSHGKRDSRFFRTKAVDREHIAGSILVTLFCEGLSKATKNQLFMSNRETFRESVALTDLLGKLQTELRDHEALKDLNLRRYAEKVKDAVNDEDGLKALEELLSTDPLLADLFGTTLPGRVAARTATAGTGSTMPGTPSPYIGVDFPTFIRRADKSTSVTIELPQGDVARASFQTDVKNNYFTRRRPPRGTVAFVGTLATPSYRLFNGRLTFTCRADKKLAIGTSLDSTITVTDKRGSGPFILKIEATVVTPREEKGGSGSTPSPRPPRIQTGPSQPDVSERDLGPDKPPAKIEKHPETGRLKIVINSTSSLLEDAKRMRPEAEEPAVAFVFKYGLALAIMGLLDSMKKTPEWESEEVECRERIETMASGIARVIVPLCLSLPKNLPKAKAKAKAA